MLRTLPLLALLLPVAAVTAAAAQLARPEPAAKPEVRPEVRQCLPVQSIRSSTVVNASTIDFALRDGSVWRSRLPRPCPQLATQQAFSYATSIPQLCAQDIITVILPVSGNLAGARCGLAPFEKQPPRPKRGPKPGSAD